MLTQAFTETMLRKISLLLSSALALAVLSLAAPVAFGQLVCLPAPRLMTVMPMGGQAGTSVEVTVTGQNAEDITELIFSTPMITAKPVVGADGKPVENKFLLTIAKDAPVGVYDMRVMSRLGISSPRAFSVSHLEEVIREKANTSVETAMVIPTNAVCNAIMTARAVDYYSFEAKKDQRLVIECAATGIDSKANPVVIFADEKGNDLLVNRTGGIIDFAPPTAGKYMIKVNDLVYQGGAEYFYRLAIQEVAAEVPAPRQPSPARVSSMSWPPVGLAATPAGKESEPNNEHYEAQKITLPCDLSGGFFPAADVDTFEFTAKKGEVWWVEVASERLGLPTDPFVLVQQVTKQGDRETFTDVAELYDIKPPLKVSSNGYSYDGPPYNAGSPDVLGKVEIKADGTYRLQVRDLFGGTRDEPSNVYRLIVRKAQPDFSLAAWAVHMTLRNGDRAAFSKPMALRAGGAMVMEVAVIRRDGFDGDIELAMDGLPAGVSASGLKIPAGKTVGQIVISADESAKPGLSMATMSGTATIDGKAVTRPCHLASMAWPVKDAKQEIPEPRLVANIPVSVSNSELAPLSIAAKEDKVWQATEGETLKIPLKAVWREEFSGTSVKLNAYSGGFATVPEFDLPLKKEEHEVVLDLAALKAKPGDYTIAFYGGAVAKYRYNPAAVAEAEAEAKKAELEVAAVAAEATKLAAAAANAPTDQKSASANAAKIAADKQKQAEAAKVAADKKIKTVTAAAAPKDIVDIVVSKPIRISVKAKPEPAEAKPAATAAAK